MALDDNQLRPADEKAGDNNGRNLVKPQTQEPYGDQELAAESKVHFEHHFAGQPLETVADRDANDALRRERYERAKVDPLFRRQQKINVPADEIEVHLRDIVVPLIPLPGDDDEADLRARLVELGLRDPEDDSDLSEDEIELAQADDAELNPEA